MPTAPEAVPMFSPAHKDPEAAGAAGVERLVPENDPENPELAPNGDVAPEGEFGILVDCRAMTDVENPGAEVTNPLFDGVVEGLLAPVKLDCPDRFDEPPGDSIPLDCEPDPLIEIPMEFCGVVFAGKVNDELCCLTTPDPPELDELLGFEATSNVLLLDMVSIFVVDNCALEDKQNLETEQRMTKTSGRLTRL